MNVVELKRLANFLRNEVSDQEFNLDSWIKKVDPVGHARRSCGTVGCAIGLGLMRIPEWKEQGFKMGGSDAFGHYPDYNDQVGFYAVADFLDIEVTESERLFSMYHYNSGSKTTRHEVAARIDNFIASKVN